MMTAEQQHQVLSSDAALLDIAGRREAREGLWILSCPGELMPDGYPFEWQYKGTLELTVLQDFCNATREAWNERTHGNKAKKAVKAATRIPDTTGDGPSTPEPAGVELPAAPDVQGPQASMEEYLQSEVDRLGSLADDLTAQRDDISARLRDAGRQLAKAQRALAALEEDDDEADV